MVQCSRMVLPSPISSRVSRSSRYFLSWGSPPMTQKGWMRLPRPMRVGPWTTTQGPRRVPAPISTPAPMMHPGPTSTSGPRRARGSMRARASIIARRTPWPGSSPELHLGGEKFGSAYDLFPDPALANEPVDLPDAAIQGDVQDQLIPRLDGPFEARLVHAHQIIHGAVVRRFAAGVKGQQAGGLRHRLEDQHAGHDGAVGEMAGEKRLVVGDILDHADGAIRHAREHLVHQEKGVAVREQPQDVVDIHRDAAGGAGFLCVFLIHRRSGRIVSGCGPGG